MKLSIDVSDKEGPITPYTVTFQEIGWERYMEVSGEEREQLSG